MNEVAKTEYELVSRPRKTTIGCWVAAVAIVSVCTFVATALRGETEGGGVFHAADQFAMVGLGLILAGGALLLTRPAVWANEHGVKIRNVVGGGELPWSVITAVSFPSGASWAEVELVDDDVMSVMAIQAVDKERAVAAIRRLREIRSAAIESKA